MVKALAVVIALVMVFLTWSKGESAAMATGEETISVVTYYPSPYGSYSEIEVFRSVRYHPVDKNTVSSPQEGEMILNSSDKKIYYYANSTWNTMGGFPIVSRYIAFQLSVCPIVALVVFQDIPWLGEA